MKIHYIYGQSYDSNIYVITGEKTTVIDTGTGLFCDYVVKRIKKNVNPVDVEQIVLTHEHYDHVGGVKQVLDLTGGKAKVFAHHDASDKIERGDSMFAEMLGGKMPKMPVDVKLSDGDTVKIGDETFKVIHTPGHTPGCICLYSEKSKSLFSGDTVFANGSFGRYDFPGGSLKDLKKSIECLTGFDVLNLYPGHDTVVEGDGNRHISMSFSNVSYVL